MPLKTITHSVKEMRERKFGLIVLYERTYHNRATISRAHKSNEKFLPEVRPFFKSGH